MNRLLDKVVIVTGAAGGIGSAAVKLFVEEGANVLAVDLREDELARAIDGLDTAHVSYYAANVTRDGEVQAYTQAAVDRYGGLDVAVLNAGLFGGLMPITDYPVDLFENICAVNIRGPWLGMRAAFPHMKRRGGGSIVLTSSVQGLSAIPLSSAYTLSKHAVVGMMRGAALEGTQHNIRVNSVHPGLTDTNMMGGIHKELAAGDESPQAVMDAWATTVPMRRYGKPREVAQLMLFLASNESSYCTGSTFVADGGLLTSWTQTPEWQ